MYRFWTPIIEPMLDSLDPRVIVEIGSDQGFNTRNLVEFARPRDSKVHAIDPLPKYDVDEWLAEYAPHLVFHQDLSLAVLGKIDHPDIVLIDGDHNWHTVINELRILETTASSETAFPLVLLHDVGWPYGRRDLYYDPEQIPQPDRQPHAQRGLRPGRRDLDADGGLNLHLFNALREGGPRNGVLTAVEDFMERSQRDLELVLVPGINSLGILFPSSLRSNDSVSELIEQLKSSQTLLGVLERVESLRIESQIAMLDAQRDRDVKSRQLDEESAKVSKLREELRAISRDLDESKRTQEGLAAELQMKAFELDEARRAVEETAASSLVTRQALEKELESEGDRARAMNAELEGARKQLKRRERDYSRLRTRRSVRVALRVASLARPVVRFVRNAKKRLGGPPRPKGSAEQTRTGGVAVEPTQKAKERRAGSRPSARDQSRLVRSVLRERAGSSATEGPLVSIIVLTRDGAQHLERLLPALDRVTTYRSFEVIVVDNASSDHSSDVLSIDRGYPSQVIRNESNRSFSEGNNQAAAQANGELLLFLNNDIEPINPGWLGSLVAAVDGEDVVAAGAELVYPVRGVPPKDLTVQHIGIGFGFRDGAVHPMNIGARDPLDTSFEGTRQVPAATAAALLVDASAFRAIGGFDEGYVYGTEDVDLCLKLREHGEIVVTGQAVLFHNESATQHETSEELTRLNRLRNHQRFAERWAPTLTRSVLIDRLSGQQVLQIPHKRTVAITLTHDDETRGWGDYYTAHGLGKAFGAAGWKVIYAERYEDRWYEIDSDVDLVISLLDSYDVRKAPNGAFTMAWVRNWVDRWLDQPWFDSFDMVVTSSHKASELIAEGSRFVPSVVPMATDSEQFTPGPEHPTFRADYVFTGNNWGHGRSVIDLLDIHPGEEFLIFGKGWDKDPRVRRYWRGHLDHEVLPDVYRSAKIVLDDTAAPTLPYGFLNGRVFDALAAGALVLTDNVDGSQEVFDGMLPTYSGAEELRAQIDRYLSDDGERRRLVEGLRTNVLAHHTFSQRPGDFLAEAIEHIGRPRAAIKIAVPDEDVQESWGDTHFADGLASALTSLGMPTEVQILPEWDAPSSQAVDVVIHLRGLSNYAPKSAHVNVLWIISHPDTVTVQECEKYDIVLVASRQHAEWLDSQTSVTVEYLPQATDHRRFYPRDIDPDLKTDVLFVGNSRGQNRVAVDWAIQQGLPLKVYGSKWVGRIPSRYLADEYFPNDDLASLYASAKVVLNDHWPDMRDRGFISNRIFDALASGAVVVSDRVHGLGEIFGDLVPTYSNPEELEEVVHEILVDEQLGKKLAIEGAKLVAEQHTFKHRAEELVQLLKSELDVRQGDLQGNHLTIQPGG